MAKQLASQARAPVKALPLDVTSAASIDSFVAAVKEGYDQQVDVLINNAGVLFRDRWDQARDAQAHMSYDTVAVQNSSIDTGNACCLWLLM